MYHLSNHAQRFTLSDEVHARPYERLFPPEHASFLALMIKPEQKQQAYDDLRALCARYNRATPTKDVSHFNVDCGVFRLKWEYHTEFVSYTFIQARDIKEPFEKNVIDDVDHKWLDSLVGEVIVASHVVIVPSDTNSYQATDMDPYFMQNDVVGAYISGETAMAFTDFRIHADGFSRFLVYDTELGARQAGRVVQRLLEIETYRMMALLAFPIARQTNYTLSSIEQKLIGITHDLAQHEGTEEDLLDSLMQLAAELEKTISLNSYRFGAAEAYYALVKRRIEEMRESRITGIQTFNEFMQRRLAPAMSTCVAMGKRQDALSARIARTGQLLRTRIDTLREQQNQDLLASMDSRAQLQLRLQETVEGLSVVAITYYSVGLIGYITKALKSAGLSVAPELVAGVSLPIIAIFAALGIRHIRHNVKKTYDKLTS